MPEGERTPHEAEAIDVAPPHLDPIGAIAPPRAALHTWPWRRLALSGMIVLAAFCLYNGITQPIIRLTQLYVFSDAHSLASAVYALYLDGELMLAAIVLVFSILLPTVKLGYLLVLATLPTERLRTRQRVLQRLEGIGKWSMHDVLILAITIVYLKSSGLSDATSQPGARYFAVSVILIMLAYGWIKHSAREVVATGAMAPEPGTGTGPGAFAGGAPSPFHPLRRLAIAVLTAAAGITLALGLSLPTIKLTKLYVWTDEHSVLTAIWALVQDDEVFLAVLIGLFSVVFPTLKLFYLMAVSNLSTVRPQAQSRLFTRLEWLGKWSMMDVLVLALIIFYVNASSFAEASALAGIYYFTASVFLTMFAYALVKGGLVARRPAGRPVPPAAPDPLKPGGDPRTSASG